MVRARFAASPVSQVHIEAIRTAIFNWLFARHVGGQFLVRIEDIDEEEASSPDSVKAVFDALEWLGLDCDEEPVYQSSRTAAYLAAAEKLVDKGWAYHQSDKGGRNASIIFGMPREDMFFNDKIRGEMRKDAREMADFTIVRSNGTPVSHLANAVDDMEMRVTHVIREEDQIAGTYRHVALLSALGANLPIYAHLPAIVNHQGKPYSKGESAASVGEFREKGYLPEALFNFLALLGWSPDDGREILSRKEAIHLFDLKSVKPAPVRMDIAKFEWMNGEYMRKMPLPEYADGFKAALRKSGAWSESVSADYLNKVAHLMQERIKTFAEAPYFSGFFFNEDFYYDEMAVKNRLKKEGVAQLLKAVKDKFGGIENFTAAATEEALRAVAGATGAPVSQIVYPLRIAVSGILMGPGLHEMLEVLGKDRVIRRIERTLDII